MITGTTIYLDVDGVLNAVSVKSPSMESAGWSEWQVEQVNGWQILFSPLLVVELNLIAARPDVTFKWLTTWEDEAANTLSSAIGLHGADWEVLHGDQSRWHGRDWWKAGSHP